MKTTVERHIKQEGNFYKVYIYSPDKSIFQVFAFDEARGWPENDARLRAIELAEQLTNPVAESVIEVYNSELVDIEAHHEFVMDKND